MTQPEFAAKAKEMLRSAATRVTHGRVAVLAALLEARRALTHSEVEARLESLHSIDRVTVYRVLDCLMELGLAHRLAGDDRVWRFTAEVRDHAGGHPHFKCNSCGNVICLDDDQLAPKVSLPAGYKGEEIELTVKGRCASCAPTQRVAKRGRRAVRGTSVRKARSN
ncbi:MAG: transcriptional repressor [Betaproteobacteria bacterium]|nr:transcriptional repressor [Betaproteobacteria bacterium]